MTLANSILHMTNEQFAERKRKYHKADYFGDEDYQQVLFDMQKHSENMRNDIAEARTHSYQMDYTISEKRLQKFIDFLGEVEDLRQELIWWQSH